MPFIFSCHLPLLAPDLPKPRGRRLTGLEIGLRCGYLPGLTRLHPSYQLGFDHTVLLVVQGLFP